VIGFRQQLNTTSFEAFKLLDITVNYPTHTWTENGSSCKISRADRCLFGLSTWLSTRSSTATRWTLNVVYRCVFVGQLYPSCGFSLATETSWVVSYGGKTIQRWRTAVILKVDISPYLRKKSSDFDEILYTAADFELDERHVIKNENFHNSRRRTAAILKIVISPYLSEQEAQLSQRDRATLRVIKYLAKSLNISWTVKNTAIVTMEGE